MSEITRADLDALQRNFTDALEKLAQSVTPREREAASKDARDSGKDLDFELRLRGLSLRDLDAASERKQQEKIDAAVEAKLAAREAEAAAKQAAADDAAKNGAGDEGGEGGGIGQKIRDGLGGKTWAQS